MFDFQKHDPAAMQEEMYEPRLFDPIKAIFGGTPSPGEGESWLEAAGFRSQMETSLCAYWPEKCIVQVWHAEDIALNYGFALNLHVSRGRKGWYAEAVLRKDNASEYMEAEGRDLGETMRKAIKGFGRPWRRAWK